MGYLYLNHGNWKGNQLLDSAYVTASIKPNGLKDKGAKKIVDCYGYSWWLIPGYKGQNIAYCRGILGQYIIVIPEKNIVILLTCSLERKPPFVLKGSGILIVFLQAIAKSTNRDHIMTV